MPAYVIADVQITDPVKYEEYKKLTPSSIADFGGKFIGRGGKTETLEGNWQPGRIVIVEFPDMESVHKWYASEGYAKAKAIRQQASTGKFLVVEGIG